MLAYPIATIAFLLLSQDAVATTGTKKTPTKTDFLRAMNKHSTRRKLSNDAKKEFTAELHGSTKQSAALRKKIMDRSTITKVPGDESAADPELKAKANDNRRKLEQNYNKYNNYKDGTDDYVHASGGYENIFGFDPTQFSVSYHRCASVKQFDDVLAATEDSETVFAEKHFAVFRFCPEQTCQGWQIDYEKCGCAKQCNKAINQGYTYVSNNYNNNNDDEEQDDEELCLSACYDSCKVWAVQQDLNTNYSGRKLDENENMQGWYNGVYYNKNPWATHDFDREYLYTSICSMFFDIHMYHTFSHTYIFLLLFSLSSYASTIHLFLQPTSMEKTRRSGVPEEKDANPTMAST